MLSNVGLPQLVARSGEEYVDIGGLASNLDRLAELRANLRTMMKQSPNTDGPRCARILGKRAARNVGDVVRKAFPDLNAPNVL